MVNVDKYKYILTDLISGGAPKVLTAAPDGWQDFDELNIRSDVYQSVGLNDIISQTFVKKGGRINDEGGYYFIKDLIDTYRTKALIQFERLELNSITKDYDPDFIGLLNVNPDAGYEITEEGIEIKTISSDKLEKIESRDEIDVNVFDTTSLDDIEIVDIDKNSITYKKVDLFLYAYTLGALGYTETFLVGETKDVYYGAQGVGVQLLGDRFQADNSSNNNAYVNDTEKAISLKITVDTSYNIKTTFADLGNVIYSLDVIYKNNLGGIVSTENIFSRTVNRSSTTTPATYDIDGTVNEDVILNVSAGYSVEIRFRSTVTLTGTIFVLASVDNNIDFIETYEGQPDSLVNGYFAQNLIKKLIALYSSETNEFKLFASSALNEEILEDEFITNGKLIRGFDSPLNVNFKDTFLSLNARTPIGFGYDKNNDIFRLEDIEYFYQNEAFPTHLGEVTKLTSEFSSDHFFNSLEGGYPDQEYEEIDGLNEINSETKYSTSLSSKNTKSIRSVYYGDTVGAELARKKPFKTSASEDTKYDDNVYIHKTDGNETLQGNVYRIIDSFLGIEQYYNISRTPRQNLERHQKVLSNILITNLSEDTQFRAAKKSTDLTYIKSSSQDEGDAVNEADNVPQADITEIVFDVWKDTFEAPYTLAIRNEIKDNPHRYYQYTDYDGEEQEGYIKQINGNPYTRLGTYTLLRRNKNRT